MTPPCPYRQADRVCIETDGHLGAHTLAMVDNPDANWIMAVDQAHGTCLTARIAALACPPRGPQCGDSSIDGGNCEAHAAAYKEWDAVKQRVAGKCQCHG